MSDKVEQNQVQAPKQEDSLFMKVMIGPGVVIADAVQNAYKDGKLGTTAGVIAGGALGGAAEAIMPGILPKTVIGGVAGGIGGYLLEKNKGDVGAAAKEAVKMGADAVKGPIILGAEELYKQNKAQVDSTVKSAVDGTKAGIKAVAKEVVSTPDDILNHIKKNPLQSAGELILGPGALITGSKMEKWLKK